MTSTRRTLRIFRGSLLALCGATLIAVAATRLLSADGSAAPASPASVPAPRDGGDRIGSKLAPDAFSRWIHTEENKPLPAGSVTLYRWWTNTCPFCEATLPAVEKLRQEFGPRGLRVVGVYHPKPPHHVDDDTIAKAAKRIGYDGPIAVDEDWSVLKKLWLSTGRRPATSVSFLVDRDGVIRYVHPGPAFYPSDKPEEARENQDYIELRQAIEALLGGGERK